MGVYLVIDMAITVGWAGEVTLIGFSVGGSAAALSGKALREAIAGGGPEGPPQAG